MASMVDSRMALTLPVLRLERLTMVMPTFCESSVRDIFLSASILSRRMMIGMVLPILSVQLHAEARAHIQTPLQAQRTIRHRVLPL